MPRIWCLSDLHLECYPQERRIIPPPADFDVLAVAGDIWESEPELAVEAVSRLADGRPAVMVYGNHDAYGISLESLVDRGRGAAAGTSVHVLDGDSIEIAGLRFAGATLWPANIRAEEKIDLSRVMAGTQDPLLNPYPGAPSGEPLYENGVALTFARLSELHQLQMQAIADAEADIVISHYPPGTNWNATVWKAPAVWLHGHIHAFERRMEGSTEIIVNPRQSRVFADRLVVEIQAPAPRPLIG